MIQQYPQGSELLLLNTIWHRPKRDDRGKYSDPAITLVYQDTITGKKGNQYIPNPDYEFFLAKEEVPIDHNMLFIEKEKVDSIKVPYKDILKEIAVLSGNEEMFYNNIRSGNRYENNKLFTYNRVFNADMHIEDHYKYRFDKMYKQKTKNLSMAYFDIEADTIDMVGDFPELGECPVNAVTLIDDERNKVYTLLLREESNPLIKDLEDKWSTQFGRKQFKKQINEKILEACRGNYKQTVRLGLDKFDFNIKFYDEEIELIQDLFVIINTREYDFVLAWNMAFDVPYIIERVKALGYDPREIIPHPDFVDPQCEYYIDERAQELAERGDYAKISSYSVFLDQLIHFASRRKGQAKVKSHKLDYIGGKFAKTKKLDYSHITRDIAKLPYLDYETFVIYNIVDTMVQKAIEIKTGDIEYIFNKALMNNTRYHKAHRQTVYLTNRTIKEFNGEDFVMGNNINKFKPKPEGKFPGAVVGNPILLEDDFLIKIGGMAIRVMRNADDFDFSSLYPSLMKEFNIAPNTEIGKIHIEGNPYPDANPFGNEGFDNGGLFIEDYISGNIIEFARRWFGMPDIIEMRDLVIKYFNNNGLQHMHSLYDIRSGLYRPFVISDKGSRPFYILEDNELERPFVVYKQRKVI